MAKATCKKSTSGSKADARKVVDYDHIFWGDSDSNLIVDPNLPLQLLIEAARRGAKMRMLLNSFFDVSEEHCSNYATAQYLAALATAGGLEFVGAVGNPTGSGIHPKWLLARVDGVTWSALGSLNSGGISCKVNLEVVLLVDARVIYNRLVEVLVWAGRTVSSAKAKCQAAAASGATPTPEHYRGH